MLEYSVVQTTEDCERYVTPKHKQHPRYYLHCRICVKYKEKGSIFFPVHDPSPHCESGKFPHCTCDWCF